jgi:hypothetical protein
VIVPEELRGGSTTFASAGQTLELGAEQMAALQEIARHLRSNQKIEAIKIYRQVFRVGLKEAKDAVEGLASGQAVAISRPQQKIEISRLEVSTDVSASTGQKRSLIGCIVISLVLVTVVVPLLLTLVPVGAAVGLSMANSSDLVAEAVGVVTTVGPTPTPGLASVAMTIGLEGIGPGQFKDARYIAVDGQGIIYVAEHQERSRVQRFDPSGNFISLWTPAEPEGIVTGLAVDGQGVVYLILSGQMARYDGESGTLLGPAAYEDGRGFDDVEATADGGVVAFRRRGSEHEIVRFNTQGEATRIVNEAIIGQTGDTEMNPHLGIDGLGNIYVLGGFSQAVFKYGAEGNFITRFGSQGDEPGQFRSPHAIAVDGQGQVYVADSRGIQVFAGDGRYLGTIEVAGVAFGLAFNHQDELFVASRTGVVKYVLNGR